MNDTRPIEAFRDACFVRAYAKINVTLDVLGRRADGYHDLATIMQTIDLYDTICLTAAEDDRVRLFCTTPELSTDDNLAVSAAQLLRQRLAITQGVVIEIVKRIPVAAGLGGGSSDAAAVLLALQQWWHLELSDADLLDLAQRLGSDVPFFLTGGLAFCEGRGERVTQLNPYWPRSMRWLLLLKPTISVSTASVFRGLSSDDYSDGSHSRAALAAFRALHEPEIEHLHNGLERSVLEAYPPVARARQHFLEAGASPARLSGSGPTLFAPFSDLDRARQAQMKLQAQGYEAYLSQAIYPGNGEVYFL
ncbi:MAG TPA: 4-(cytidine 5'-diphospho)-2-C-methyl-D-erythritol kinase [Ktedonobacteraceae bacterium]